MSAARACGYCGASIRPFQLPPHECPGLITALARRPAIDPKPATRTDRTPIIPGDTVEWTELKGRGQHERSEGVVSHVVERGKTVLVRKGGTLVELNMGRVRRIKRKDA